MEPKNGATIWLTGISGAGKTTIALRLVEELRKDGHAVELLDGDEVRKAFGAHLGFSKEDRDEHIRRIGYLAKLLSRNGVIVVVAAISPYREVRNEVKGSMENFIEVFVNAPLEVCEARDVKGLYKRARSGELLNFTGVSDPYESPLAPDVEVRTDIAEVEACVALILESFISKM